MDENRVKQLKSLIQDLHAGRPFEEVKRRFDEFIRDVDPTEIAQMEQQLIREGMPVAEVQRLCDLHVGVFKTGLEKQEVPAPPGHPIHTAIQTN